MAIRRLHKVGIILPRDILAYMLLHKLPSSLKVIKQQITHSEIGINPELVLDHLQILANDFRNKEENKIQLTALQTQNEKGPFPKCTGGKNNPNSYHSPANCWALHPELRDIYLKKKYPNGIPSTVSCFHTKNNSFLPIDVILDSGSSSHMFCNSDFFIAIEYKEIGHV